MNEQETSIDKFTRFTWDTISCMSIPATVLFHGPTVFDSNFTFTYLYVFLSNDRSISVERISYLLFDDNFFYFKISLRNIQTFRQFFVFIFEFHFRLLRFQKLLMFRHDAQCLYYTFDAVSLVFVRNTTTASLLWQLCCIFFFSTALFTCGGVLSMLNFKILFGVFSNSEMLLHDIWTAVWFRIHREKIIFLFKFVRQCWKSRKFRKSVKITTNKRICENSRK